MLDEADRMLDMGFIRDIKKIIEFLPKDRQNMMFSAIFSVPIKKLALGLLNDPVEIRASVQNQAAPTVEHLVHPCDRARKVDLLCHLIKTNQWKQVLVFARTKHGADKVVKILCNQHVMVPATPIRHVFTHRQSALILRVTEFMRLWLEAVMWWPPMNGQMIIL